MDRRQFITSSGIVVGLLAGCASPEQSKPTQTSVTTVEAPETLEQPTLGASDKDIPALQIFVDYGCPHCLTFEQDIMPKLKRDYIETERLFVEHYDFPLPVRDLSKPAAVSGRVVQHFGGMEAFWSYMPEVMSKQENFSYEVFRQAASDIGLNGDKVVNATRTGGFEQFVEEDKQYGEELGVPGTPALFVNKELLQPGDYETISNQLDDMLSKNQESVTMFISNPSRN